MRVRACDLQRDTRSLLEIARKILRSETVVFRSRRCQYQLRFAAKLKPIVFELDASGLRDQLKRRANILLGQPERFGADDH